ncbi:YlmH/Sll1252 family protein [Ruminococcaceae bacterium OttesenSCG-928-D13]|nr:YlmH/Sll1252 family protein [Ruminococcaceae bacterium OttesenSCG-928-D13]
MDDTVLLTHMEDLVRRAQKTGMAHSKFLTPAEAAEVHRAYSTRRDIGLVLDGGFAGAERCVAAFLQPDWGIYAQDEVLTALALKHRKQDTVRHQDVLGAVLGLGLSRDVLGDICVEPGTVYLVCLASMAGFISAELQKVGRIGVAPTALGMDELPDPAGALKEKMVTVASLRLDAVVAAAFNWSRSDACDAIVGGKVQLAHRECLSTSHAVACGEIISVRGKGRVKLLSVEGETRKGRQRITLGYY